MENETVKKMPRPLTKKVAVGQVYRVILKYDDLGGMHIIGYGTEFVRRDSYNDTPGDYLYEYNEISGDSEPLAVYTISLFRNRDVNKAIVELTRIM